jgi:2-polyprenyl-6-methoxyphenol hydroxylase-like FAD-dependent oxidoreductase
MLILTGMHLVVVLDLPSVRVDTNVEVVAMRVIIAGAGVVGLTAAVALRKAGNDVLVCEQAREVRAAGASIGLWRNAFDVFDANGVGEATRALGTPISTWFYDASGTPFRASGASEADHAFLLLPRPQLAELLAESAGVQNLRFGARITGFDETPESVTATFADGSHETADLLIGADGVYSAVREHLVTGFPAQEHRGHHAWRGVVPSQGEPAGGSVLTIGPDRTRGGFTRTYGGLVMWMVNQFDCGPLTGSFKEQALTRAERISGHGWNAALAGLIESTPDEAILHNQIMFVPPLPRWTSDRVVLVGDAAHGLSPHIAAGGTLGIEDVGVLSRAFAGPVSLPAALRAYEADRIPRYQGVARHSLAVEHAADAAEYAEHYAAFSHWMLTG